MQDLTKGSAKTSSCGGHGGDGAHVESWSILGVIHIQDSLHFGYILALAQVLTLVYFGLPLTQEVKLN